MAWISTAKLAAVSIAIAILAVAANIPATATEIVPRAWSSFGSWLKPPYLYVVVNGIIISIAASSRFHCHHKSEVDDEKLSAETSTVVVVSPDNHYYHHGRQEMVEVIKQVDHGYVDRDEMKSTVEMIPKPTEIWEDDEDGGYDDDDDDGGDILELSVQKPIRKPAKPITISRAGPMSSKTSKPKQHETLENTWKMITEGRSTPLSRQMKKCDTWENHVRRMADREVGPMSVETFSDRTNHQMPAVNPKLRKEPSLSQDELNRRVEAFINKFNEDMRLQRQESLNQYMEMINRGAH